MQRRWLSLLLLALFALMLPGCSNEPGDDDDAAGDDDDTTGDDDDSAGDDDDSAGDDDDSAGDDDDSASAPPPAPPGSALCASGGPATSASGLSAVLCTGPLTTGAAHRSATASGSFMMQSGPITRIAP